MDEPNEPQIINNIQPVQQQQQQPVQQYTITLDGKTLKSNQIHYKIEPSGAITIQEPYVQQITTAPAQQTTIRLVIHFSSLTLISILSFRPFLSFQ